MATAVLPSKKPRGSNILVSALACGQAFQSFEFFTMVAPVAPKVARMSG